MKKEYIDLESLHIPLEDSEELLIEYGRAIGWVNMIEFIVENLIRFGGELLQTNLKKEKRPLEEMTLGGKIPLLKGTIDPDILSKLRELNKKRIILAHGASGTVVNSKDGKTTKIGSTIRHKGVKHDLTPEFLKDITRQCKEVSLLL